MGLKSPLRPAKLTMSVSVTVRPCDSHSWPTATSSKYRCCSVNDMLVIPGPRVPHPTGKSIPPGAHAARCDLPAGQQRDRAALRAVRVDADVDDLRLGDAQDLAAALHL